MTRVRPLGPGDTLDMRYRVIRVIARGGFGEVFEGEQIYTGRRVAIKHVLSPEALAVSAAEIFLREARALARIEYRGVVRVLDAAHDLEHGLYLVLEFLEGHSLESLLARRGTLSVPQTLFIGRQICGALRAIHDEGIVHRDLKPANVMVTRTGAGEQVKLVDFGIAQIDALVPGVRLPRAGTPAYMAPEQLLVSAHVDPSADLYALGVILFECLLGDIPHHGEGPEPVRYPGREVLAARLGARPDVSGALAEVIIRALAPDPQDRLSSARLFDHALAVVPQLHARRERLLTANPRDPAPCILAPPAELPTARLRATPGHPATARYERPVPLLDGVGFHVETRVVRIRADRVTSTSLTGIASEPLAPGERGTLTLRTREGDEASLVADVAWVDPSSTGSTDVGLRIVAFVFVDVPAAARRILLHSIGPATTE